MSTVSARLSRPAYAELGEDQHLAPIFPPGMQPTLDDWRAMRAELMARWQEGSIRSAYTWLTEQIELPQVPYCL